MKFIILIVSVAILICAVKADIGKRVKKSPAPVYDWKCQNGAAPPHCCLNGAQHERCCKPGMDRFDCKHEVYNHDSDDEDEDY